MRSILCRVFVAAIVLLAPTCAAASTFPTRPPEWGPVLAGSKALWAIGRSDGGFNLEEAAPGAAPATFARFSPPPLTIHLTPQLAASPTRIVLDAMPGDSVTDPLSRMVLTAPLGGAFETLDQDCDLNGSADLPRTIDVSGQLVVFPRCTSHGNQEVVVRDYSISPPAEEVVPGAQVHGLRVAGRYVAWLAGGTTGVSSPSGIAVYDRVLHTIAYSIPRSGLPGDIHDLDLQDDGKVAFSFAGRTGAKIAWASLAEPIAHVLGLRARYSYEVRISGDRIGFESAAPACCGAVSSATVGITDLSGHVRRVGNRGEGSVYTDDFDFDGQRISWWSYGCTRAFVHVLNVDGPPSISPPRTGCRLRFRRMPSIARGKVHLYVNCFGFPLEMCDARNVTLTIKRGGRRVVVGRGPEARRVALTSGGRALVRRHGRSRVLVEATLSDDAGHHERRFGQVAL